MSEELEPLGHEREILDIEMSANYRKAREIMQRAKEEVEALGLQCLYICSELTDYDEDEKVSNYHVFVHMSDTTERRLILMTDRLISYVMDKLGIDDWDEIT